MTTQQKTGFRALCKQLAVTLNVTVTDDAIVGLSSALDDIPYPLLEAASRDLARGSDYWPRPVEWRRAVDAVQQRRQHQRPDLRDVPEVVCATCEDTGWEQRACPGRGPTAATEHQHVPEWWPCERDKAHYSHTYAVECTCRPTNARYQAEHHQTRAYAPPKTEKGERASSGWTPAATAADKPMAGNVRAFIQQQVEGRA